MYYWCFQCEKVFKSDCIPNTCPFCGADISELWEWKGIQELHPEYPKEPVHGEVYPLK